MFVDSYLFDCEYFDRCVVILRVAHVCMRGRVVSICRCPICATCSCECMVWGVLLPPYVDVSLFSTISTSLPSLFVSLMFWFVVPPVNFVRTCWIALSPYSEICNIESTYFNTLQVAAPIGHFYFVCCVGARGSSFAQFPGFCPP